MTLLAELEATNAEPERSEPTPSPPGLVREISLRAIVGKVLAALLVLLLSLLILEDPVAHLWYSTRQTQRFAGYHQARPRTRPGQTLAILQAPNIALSVPVVEGDSGDLLRGGPGHAPATPVPGAVGNAVVFGHQKGWGGPFSQLTKLSVGDAVDVQMHGSNTPIQFTITSVLKTTNDAPYLKPSTDHRLTLVTGSGGRLSGRYFVVTAVSGTTGSVDKTGRSTGNPSSGSFFGRDLLLFLLRAGGVAVVAYLLLRRYRPGAVVAVVSPLALSALLALALDIDRLLPVLG
jgi:LPXTG-site transpeptidase (sortase) family protein